MNYITAFKWVASKLGYLSVKHPGVASFLGGVGVGALIALLNQPLGAAALVLTAVAGLSFIASLFSGPDSPA